VGTNPRQKRDAVSLFLFLTVALVPITMFRGPAQSAIADVLSLAAMPILAVIALKRRAPIRISFLAPAFVILLASLLAMTNAVSVKASAVTLIQDVYLFLWFVALVNVLRDRRDLTSFRTAWVWVANAVALYGLAMVLIPGHVSIFDLAKPTGPRALGTFPDPNMFADYLVLSLFLALSLEEEKGRWMRWGSAALLLTGIIATKSNGGLVSLLVGSMVWILVRAWTLRVPRAALVGLVLFAASLGLGGLWLVNGFGVGKAHVAELTSGSVLGRAGHSSEGRFHIWSSLLSRYVEEPLGIGPGNSRELQLTMNERERPDSFLSKEAHNDYLGYLIERGPLALLALLALKLQAFGKVAAWWRDRSSRGLRTGGALAAAALGALAASSVHSFTIENLHFRHVWLFLALVCAMDGMVFRPRAERQRAGRFAVEQRRATAVAT